MSFKAYVSLLLFCLDKLLIGISGMLRAPAIIVVLSVSPFMVISICLIYWEGNGNPLQYSCLENPVDRGAWLDAVHGIAQSRAQLKQLSISIYIEVFLCWVAVGMHSHIDFLNINQCLPLSLVTFLILVYFVCISIVTPGFFLLSFAWNNVFLYPHFQFICSRRS